MNLVASIYLNRLLFGIVWLLTSTGVLKAQQAVTPDPPYQVKLERLAEVLGSIHFLRRLCGEQSTVWRDSMGELIAHEVPTPERRAKLIASFNHGYRSFDGVYVRCNDAAAEALSKFMSEGEALTLDVSTRYGN